MRKKIIPITLSVAMMINTAVLPASAAQKPVANPGRMQAPKSDSE